ncbi:MAG: glycoside hydrolase family 9 protein [Chitinophagaceae bacterium]
MRQFKWMFFLLLPIFVQSQISNENIRLNQIGFYPGSNKIAIVSVPVSGSNFYITTTNLRDTLFRGQLKDTIKSEHSSLVTRIANFSGFTSRGSYVLSIPGLGHSHVFMIRDHVLQEVAKSSLKAFYYQRSSINLDPSFAGKWHRSAGHPDTKILIHPTAASAKRLEGFIISSPGGWYDAGDYNKYIVNSGITVSTLLSAYEHFPKYFASLQINIPESGSSIPDLLDETIYNIRWMLTMQDQEDGGVYHKCTNASFDGMVMPGITTEPRYVVQKSTAAALDFVAVMAQSARVFSSLQKSLPGFSDSCRNAALKAWKWALVHPADIYTQEKNNEQFLPKITTGTYGDGKIEDEWLWASAEMYRTTGDLSYLKKLSNANTMDLPLQTWNQVGLLALYTLLSEKNKIPMGYESLWAQMKQVIVKKANELVAYQDSSAFHIPMGSKVSDFVWGSNANAANQGMLLIYAHRLTGNKKYVEAASANADYLLGRNATGYCFVTGFGGKSPMHPHHRPSIADGITEPIPGLLVGGPNPFMQDHCNYQFTERETAYTDEDCSYASNEIAINWNAPAVYLFNAIEALMGKN